MYFNTCVGYGNAEQNQYESGNLDVEEMCTVTYEVFLELIKMLKKILSRPCDLQSEREEENYSVVYEQLLYS